MWDLRSFVASTLAVSFSELLDVWVGAKTMQPHVGLDCTGKSSPNGNLGFSLASSFHILMGLTLGNQSTLVEDFLYKHVHVHAHFVYITCECNYFLKTGIKIFFHGVISWW